MQLSNEPAFIDATWEQLEKETKWILSPGDGPKVVFLRFLDIRDIISLPVNTTIFLDTTPPQLEVIIDGGATYTTDTTVDVEVVYVDSLSASSIWVSRVDHFNGIEPQQFMGSFEWELYRQEGLQGLFIKVIDLAGNEAVGRSSIHFATIHPEVTVRLPDGERSNSEDHVPIIVDVIDPYGGPEVQISMDTDPGEGAEWLPNDGVLQAPIPEGILDGDHLICVRVRNAAGLESKVVNVTVILDRVVPSVKILGPVDGSSIPQKGFDVMLELLSSDPSGIAEVMFRVDGGDWTLVPGSSLSTIVTIDDFGTHTIEVEVIDGAGNRGSALTIFILEDAEARVGSSGSMAMLLFLIAVAVIVGVAYESRRRKRGGFGLGFLDNLFHHPDDNLVPVPERTEVREEAAQEEDVPSTEDGTDEIDHSGWVESV